MSNNHTLRSSQTKSNKLQYTDSLKHEKSHNFFKDTRINSCSYVKAKGNQIGAVPFYAKPKQSYADKMEKSEYTTSFSYDVQKVRPALHCGYPNKPLEKYDSNSYRSRMPLPDVKMASKNASQVELGDRYQKDNKHFLSHSKNQYGNFGKIDPVTNPGILAQRTKWHHYLQSK